MPWASRPTVAYAGFAVLVLDAGLVRRHVQELMTLGPVPGSLGGLQMTFGVQSGAR